MGLKSPLFIVGCPRSGTTLLASLLERTRYGAPVETHFITKYYKRLKRYEPLSKKDNFQRLVRDIIKERPVRQWNINYDIDLLWTKLKKYSYSEIVHLICMERFKRFDKSMWSDKTPHYILDIQILYKLFPESKFIYIVRDGRDVALSLLKKKWGPKNVYSCAILWKNCNSQEKHLEEIERKGNLFRLKYEELLCNPSEIVKNIYNFLGERIGDRDLESIISIINRTNFYKWKKQMSDKDIKIFESVANDVLMYHGYEVINENPCLPFYEKAYYKLHDTVGRLCYLFELNTIDWFKINFMGKEPFGE